MVHLDECLTNQTPIYVTTKVIPKKSLIRRTERPRKVFMKKFNPAEFIGEELCRIRDIRCSHYFIAGINYYTLKDPIWYEDAVKRCSDFQIASKTNHRKGYQYHSVSHYGFAAYDHNLFEKMLDQTPDEENRKQLCKELLELMALDIYMGQTDRYAFNYEFEEDAEHHIHLAPVYDFEHSVNPQFLNKGDICFGDLYSFRTIEDCKEFIRKYPMFRDILSSYLDVDLEYVVRDAFGRRRMKMPENKYPIYREFDQERKELIKSIVQ